MALQHIFKLLLILIMGYFTYEGFEVLSDLNRSPSLHLVLSFVRQLVKLLLKP